MRPRRLLLSLVLLLPLLLGGLRPAHAAEPPAPAAAVDYRDGCYFGHLTLRVAVGPELALAVLTDFDHMAAFVPNLSSSRIVERRANVYRVAQEGRADFGPFSFRFTSERRIEVFPEGRIVARALAGSTRHLHSELRLSAGADGTTAIDYRLEMIPDVWMPSALGSTFLRHELSEQFAALAREMERRQGAKH